MATNTLSVLKPSVNNLTTRIFVRAAGLDFEELDVWGKKTTPEFLQKDPAVLTEQLTKASKKFEAFTAKELPALNSTLGKQKLEPIAMEATAK